MWNDIQNTHVLPNRIYVSYVGFPCRAFPILLEVCEGQVEDETWGESEIGHTGSVVVFVWPYVANYVDPGGQAIYPTIQFGCLGFSMEIPERRSSVVPRYFLLSQIKIADF